jgi:DNA-binding GntR family transcriptional regulator
MQSEIVEDDEQGESTLTPDHGVAKLGNVALRDRAYKEIANALRGGRFMPGSMVTIRGLAALLGTSTMPVREAVSRLVTERALEMLPNRTLRVPQMSLKMLEELVDARETVEGRAAALAAMRMTNVDFSKIKAANERYGHALDAGDVAAALVANEEMHHAICCAARSPLLLSIIETLWLQSGPYVASLLGRAHTAAESLYDRGVIHHFSILAALAKRDPEAASAAIRNDLRDAAEWYKAQLFAEGVPQSGEQPVRRGRKPKVV